MQSFEKCPISLSGYCINLLCVLIGLLVISLRTNSSLFCFVSGAKDFFLQAKFACIVQMKICSGIQNPILDSTKVVYVQQVGIVGNNVAANLSFFVISVPGGFRESFLCAVRRSKWQWATKFRLRNISPIFFTPAPFFTAAASVLSVPSPSLIQTFLALQNLQQSREQ